MRNFLISALVIAIISAVLQLFLPWWIIAVVAFGVAYLHQQSMLSAFAAAFIGIFFLWAVYAFAISFANEHLLAKKIAELFPLKGKVFVLFAITGIIGGLVAGFAAMSGAAAKQVLSK